MTPPALEFADLIRIARDVFVDRNRQPSSARQKTNSFFRPHQRQSLQHRVTVAIFWVTGVTGHTSRYGIPNEFKQSDRVVLNFRNYAPVCNRTRSSRCRSAVRSADTRNITAFVAGVEGHRTADSVAAQLRHRGQGLLRLSCAGRGYDSGAWPQGRHPGGSNRGSAPINRPSYAGVADSGSSKEYWTAFSMSIAEPFAHALFPSGPVSDSQAGCRV